MTKSLALLILAVLSYSTQGAELVCPSSIAVKEILNQSDDGWIVGDSGGSHGLARITFFDGDPKNQASLAPDRDFKLGKERVAVWKFGDGQTPIWFSCEYLNTSITLMRELPVYHQCRVVYGIGSIVKHVECQ